MLTAKHPTTRYDGFRATNMDALCGLVERRLNARLVRAPTGRALDAFANSYQLPASSLWFCSYGVPVALSFADDDYVRVQMAHAAAGKTVLGSRSVEVTPSQSCASPAAATIEFPEGFQQLVWRVDAASLTRKLVALTGVPVAEPPRFEPALHFGAQHPNDVTAICNCILAHLGRRSPLMRPVLLAELEQSLIVAFLCNSQHQFRALLDASPQDAPPWRVRRVEEYIEANWNRPLDIEAIASVAGVSVRSIYRSFRSSRGYTPMDFVKRQRLLHARSLLENPDGVMTVTQTALACGFGDVSQFSRDFARAFGESASAVLSRSRARRS